MGHSANSPAMVPFGLLPLTIERVLEPRENRPLFPACLCRGLKRHSCGGEVFQSSRWRRHPGSMPAQSSFFTGNELS